MTRWMRDLVEVQGGFKPSVQLPGDFYSEEQNRHFVENFIPNQEILDIFKSIRDSLMPGGTERARLFVGTFGTGKSDLMLMIANYLTRPADDPLLKPFFERLRRLDHAKSESIYQARLQKPPFLLVLLQAETANTFSSFVLNGLKNVLEQQKVGYLLGTTYYKAAIEKIEDWEQKRPDIIQQLDEVLTTEFHGRTLTRLKSDLNGPRGDMALDIFRQAVEKTISMPFAPTATFERPYEAFQDVADKLIATNRYSGVVVIADEFTSLLTKLGESAGGSDSKAIDNLAESAVRSGPKQLHFYAVSFETIETIPSVSKASRDALERIRGRFGKPYTLATQNSEEMISVVISKLPPLERLLSTVQGQVDDLLNVTMQLWNSRAHGKKDRAWLTETVVRGCFPLHPLTLFCLPDLNRVLAQNNRTMFSFLWDEQQGLKGFISKAKGEPENGWLPLFTVDMLFDYFVVSLQEKRADLDRAYQDACRKLTPAQVERELEGRLLRAMVILEIANQRADQQILRHAVGKPAACSDEVTQAIEELIRSGVIYPSQTGYYNLVKRGGVDPTLLHRLIAQQAQQIARSPCDTLNEEHPLTDVEATNYNSERNTTRSLAAHFVHPAELTSAATLDWNLQNHEGLLWYVVPSTEQEREESRTKALQLTSDQPRLVIAVPNQPSDLQTRLLRKQALEIVRAAPDHQASDYQELLSDQGHIGRDYNTMFAQARRYYEQPNNFTWFRNGRTVPISVQAHVDNLASAVMEATFPATPRHGTRQHLSPNSKKQYLNIAIDKLLQAPFKLPTKSSRKPDESILLDGASALGLIRRVGKESNFYEYNVCSPEAKLRESHDIWQLLKDELSKGTDWAAIRSLLIEPPYGLYLPVLKLLLAAFYRYNQNELEIYERSRIGSKPIDVTAETINKIVDTPISYTFRYQPLQEVQAKFLRRVLERALYTGTTSLTSPGETASLRNRVAKDLRSWVEKIPVAARSATVEQLIEIYPTTPEEILKAGVALLHTALLPQEAATAVALLDKLPIELGLPADCTRWSEESLDQGLAKLESACQHLLRFEKSFKEYVAQRVGEVFDVIEPSKHWEDMVKPVLNWRQRVAAVEHHMVNALDARDLIAELDRASSFEQVFFKALPERWLRLPLDRWQTIAIYKDYIQRLQAAKAIIEAKSTELGVAPLKTKPIATPTMVRDPAPARQPVNPANPVVTAPSLPTTNGATTANKVQQAAISTVNQTDDSAKPTTSAQRAELPTPNVAVVPSLPTPAPAQKDATEEPFRQIVAIIDQLPRKAQYRLWERLVEKYDS